MKLGLLFVLVVLCVGTALAGPELRWSPSATTIGPGDVVTLSIMLDEAVPVRTLETYVTFDSDVITSVTGGPGALFSSHGTLFAGFENVAEADPAKWHGYCVILGAGEWAVGPGELYRWTIRAAAPGVSGLAADSVTLLPPGGGQYPDVLLLPAAVTVQDPASPVAGHPAAGPYLALEPNPFNPLVRIRCLGEPVTLQGFDVYDARGRRVASRLSAPTDGAAATFTWDARDDAGQAQPSGVYVFVATSRDGRRISLRGTLLR